VNISIKQSPHWKPKIIILFLVKENLFHVLFIVSVPWVLQVDCQWRTYSFTKMTVMWDITLCSVVELDQHLRGAYCLQHQGKDGGSTHFWNISLLNETTWCHVPKDCHLYTCCCENLKSHSLAYYFTLLNYVNAWKVTVYTGTKNAMRWRSY
jgi:hypothetical protein